MRAIKRLLVVLLLLLLAAGGYLWFALSRPYQGYSREAFVDVPRGATLRGIARLLEQNGVLRSAIAFELYSRWHPGHTLQAGEYRFDRPMTPAQVFDKLARGDIFFVELTTPEGWTTMEIAAALDKEGIARRDDFLQVVHDPALIRDLAPDAPSLEGFLFPATYQFTRHTTPEEIAAAMVRRFRDVWSTLQDTGANPHGLSTLQLVTLASLAERETPDPAERPIITGVFYNRLARRMPLECDPTVIYALELRGDWAGTLSTADLRLDSPYNTYRRTGLPPGPIGNPGQTSLRAALFPPEVDYLYFVANTEGGHFFSRTLAEHNRNVARYHHLRDRARSLPPGR